MAKMNWDKNSSSYISSHTINPKWNSKRAYKAHLNSAVTVIKPDGTTHTEKPMTGEEINKVNKLKKRRNSSRSAKRAEQHKKKKAEQQIRSTEINNTIAENKKRYGQSKTCAPQPSKIIVSHVKPVARKEKPKPVVHMHPPVEHKFIIPTKEVNN